MNTFTKRSLRYLKYSMSCNIKQSGIKEKKTTAVFTEVISNWHFNNSEDFSNTELHLFFANSVSLSFDWVLASNNNTRYKTDFE